MMVNLMFFFSFSVLEQRLRIYDELIYLIILKYSKWRVAT